jgi:flagellar biosynthetic protein FliR
LNAAFIDSNVQIFFLVFARIFAMLELTPIITASGMPFAARAGLSFFTAVVVAPVVTAMGYALPGSGLAYALLLLTEVLIGVLIGFFLIAVFAVMTSAGQMFSLQMGFAATEMFDPMSQIETPVMGQFLNLAGFMVFFSTFGMQKLFFVGITGSFKYFNASNFIFSSENIAMFALKGVVLLFGQALIIAMPLVGSLFLVSVTMGLLSKAAPQMNLMMVGFPIQIAVGFILLFLALPNMLSAFNGILDNVWYELDRLFASLREQGG